MIKRTIYGLCFVIALLSCQLRAEWPSWLGQDLNQTSSWQVSSSEHSVAFLPVRETPSVWVLVSRKARSYDTAIATMLKVYKQELSATSFRVFLLPETPSALRLWLKQAERNASLIYVVGSKATVALHDVYAGGTLPVVSVNAKDPVLLGLTDNYRTSGNNFAYTSLNLPADITLSFLRRFNPELRQIGILYAKSNTSAYVTQYLPLKAQAEKSDITVFGFEVDENDPNGGLGEVMQQQMLAIKQADPQLEHSILWLTGSSSLLERMEEIYAHTEQAPLLTVVPDAVNGSANSALMSVGVGFENNAHQAALYGIQILRDGKSPSALPVGVLSPPDISISFKQADRLNAKLPFVLIEMASDIYAQDGEMIRAAGMSMEKTKP